MLFCYDSVSPPVLRGFNQVELEDGRTAWTWAKGYFFDESGELWVDHEIIRWLTDKLKQKTLSEIVPLMNGGFSFVIYWVDENKVSVGMDRYGFFPIYVHVDDGNIYFGDDYWAIVRRLPAYEYSPEAAMGMVIIGHTPTNQTLLKGVGEFSPASIHSIKLSDNKIVLNSERYWRYSSRFEEDVSYGEWQEETTDLINRLFSRFSQAINKRGWSVSVPLSSGYDSRLVLGMFARNGVPLSAFSYGPTGNQESELAGQMAQSVSVDFQFVPVDTSTVIDEQLITLMTERIGMRARFTTGLGGQLSLKNYSDDVVYMPGHPGNLPTGSAYARGFTQVRSKDQMVQQLINNMSYPVPDDFAIGLFPNYWNPQVRAQTISGDWDYDPGDPVGSIHSWGWEVHSPGLILAEMRTYDQFGRWILPYSDYELVDFFARVPYKHLLNRHLFIQSLLEDIYIDDLNPLAEVPIAGRGNIKLPELEWKDKLLLKMGPSVAGDYILRRNTQSKLKVWEKSKYIIPDDPTGPDPIDYWWHTEPNFKDFIIDYLGDWNGMNGIVDTKALQALLKKPMPLKFKRYSIPSIMTLCAFQKLIEGNRSSDRFSV